MAALRALLFAVFGGFIGAAPAAPAGVADANGFADAAKQTQKDERPGCGIPARPARGVAAAPPHAGTAPLAAESSPPAAARPPVASVAPLCADRGRRVPPPSEDVRAGLLDLPPPAR